ncbi:MAG: hypothetical protein H6508_06620 [Calditrichaeota bacterium]|nr:hypothetical protein [Calditrichota bacterium]
MIACILLLAAGRAQAYHFALTTGYANSTVPETAEGVERGELFKGGSGYVGAVRFETARRHVYWGPSLLFWNNVTGNATQSSRTNYFQLEVGGRLSYRTATVPDFYAGAGLGYSFAQASYRERYFDAPSLTFDGDFPTASVHLGVKTDASRNGVGVIGELSYHWGLDEPSAPRSVGPAEAYLVQIGVFFDSQSMMNQ